MHRRRRSLSRGRTGAVRRQLIRYSRPSRNPDAESSSYPGLDLSSSRAPVFSPRTDFRCYPPADSPRFSFARPSRSWNPSSCTTILSGRARPRDNDAGRGEGPTEEGRRTHYCSRSEARLAVEPLNAEVWTRAGERCHLTLGADLCRGRVFKLGRLHFSAAISPFRLAHKVWGPPSPLSLFTILTPVLLCSPLSPELHPRSSPSSHPFDD